MGITWRSVVVLPVPLLPTVMTHGKIYVPKVLSLQKLEGIYDSYRNVGFV